uniref:sulfatase-like hydrolase/transferase n=1 Tax=uncultured Rhizobium sp. TaxID=155567 RepID=UPI0026045299|nr:sulfatase-like hydrolase/transferase [uncultured Rhizobium sp.]
MSRKILDRKPGSRQFSLLGMLLFSAVGWFAIALPDHPDAIVVDAFARLPLEVPLLGLALLFARGRPARFLAGLVTVLVFAILLLKLADIGTQAAFQRPFNPYLDARMLADGWNLLSGSIGIAATLAAILAIVAALLGFGFLFRRAIGWMAMAEGRMRSGLLVAFAAPLLIGAFGFAAGQPRVEARMSRYLLERLALVASSVGDLRAFEADLARADGQISGAGLFSAITGQDVVLIFVESYGRSAIEDPRYASVTTSRLQAIETQLASAGLSSASAWVGSPTVGGLSWLAHGTLLSGLWVDSQARYDRLMRSEKPSLNRLFVDAGWKSVAVMPAITMAWPEAAYFGYDRILAAADLGYRGQPFNWVTMPDQYTLSAFERLVRALPAKERKPVMVEIALISSHAPWTPVASLVDWQSVGDGSVFDAQATSGDAPSVVWADPERVRAHYIQTIDYSLETLGSYMTRFGKDTVFVILGDHQPAAIVTGADAPRSVPLHVVSADAALIDRFRRTGFAAGMIPKSDTREWPMDQMRGVLIDLFTKVR